VATVAILGTLDTKAIEHEFVRERVRAAGCDVILIDAGVSRPWPDADITADEVAAAAGEDRATLAAAGDRGHAVEAMSRGAAAVVQKLYEAGRLQGILGLGGAGGSWIISAAMRALPVGVPKMLVSTVASGDTRPYVGHTDIAMMYSVVDIAGINTISRQVFANAAAGIAGMAIAAQTRGAGAPGAGESARPRIGATMFGVTTPCVTVARERLERLGYEVLVFHATGVGGQSMEALIRAGVVSGALDVTTTELADELVGGVFSAGPDRLEAAGSLGIPQVVSLGALDIVNFGPLDTVPDRFRDRSLYVHNPAVTLLRTSPAECADLGRIIARKLNGATGPVAVFIPHGGVSMIDAPGFPFHDPVADAALANALKAELRPEIEVIESVANINDPAFGLAMADRLDDLYRTWAGSTAATTPD